MQAWEREGSVAEVGSIMDLFLQFNFAFRAYLGPSMYMSLAFGDGSAGVYAQLVGLVSQITLNL